MKLWHMIVSLAQTLRDRPSSLIPFFGPRAAGPLVTPQTALTLSAVYGCVRIISESLAQLPWHVHERRNSKTTVLDNDVSYLLSTQPNPEMGAFSFREAMVAHALTWGNGYAEIERDAMGRPLWLWLLPPHRVKPARDERTNELVYVVWNETREASTIPARDMFVLHGLGYDGMTGYSPIELARRSISAGLSMEEFAESFYVNGAVIGGIIKNKTSKLSPKAVKAMLKEFNLKFSGPSKAFRTMYLDSDMDYQSLGIPAKDAQFVESRTFTVRDIARWYRVPPHKLADLERATFTNIEHQSLEFVVDTLMPWIVRLEQEANIKLIGRNSRYAGQFTRMNVMALLRGDMKSRYEAYAIGRQWGWLSVNRILELEDMNPIGKDGDVYLMPSNMIDVKKRNETPAPNPLPAPVPEEDNEQGTEEDERGAMRNLLKLKRGE